MTMIKGYLLSILGDGHVRYLDHLGSDQRIAEAARTSYQQGSKGKEADDKLIRYLFLNRHTSPFEQCNLSLEIKMPIFCMRQFVRHRTFRLNEWSGRYTELPDENYLPAVWRRQLGPGENKQGSGKDTDPVWNEECTNSAMRAFRACRTEYEYLLDHGVAKELARIVLPLATFTQIHVNMDLHNLMHMLYLRTDSHAQLELQELARAIAVIAMQIWPVTIGLFQQFQPKMMERLSPFDCNPLRVTEDV